MKTRLSLLVLMVLLAGSCAPGADPSAGVAGAPGFWLGLWHGLIVPVTFVVSLFDHDVGIYAVRNSGALYDLGFVLGVLCHHGGTAASRRGLRRRKLRAPE
jgi:hypothetical protein